MSLIEVEAECPVHGPSQWKQLDREIWECQVQGCRKRVFDEDMYVFAPGRGSFAPGRVYSLYV